VAFHAGLHLMSAEKQRSLTRPEQLQLDDALAALLASTRRTKRSLNLADVNEKLRTATRLMGSLRAVANALGLSDETVRQFGRVGKLSSDVKKFLESGQITSMDLADRLSRLPAADQYPIAAAVVSGTLDARDVRAILPLRKAMPRVPVQQLIRRIRGSRNIKEYVAEFLTPHPPTTPATLLRRLAPVIRRPEVRKLEIGDAVGRLYLTANGKKSLQHTASRQGLTKGALLQRLIEGRASQRARR
jgi:hypothetical protein